MIRPVELSDAAAISKIYNYYIDETVITFEYERVDVDEIESRIQSTVGDGYPYLVYVDPDSTDVVGYAYAGRWRKRMAYQYVVESAIYLRNGMGGQGIGKQLYSELFNQLRERGFRRVIAGISIPNEGSARMHESLGFRRVGVFTEVGYKFDKWIDAEFWQLEL